MLFHSKFSKKRNCTGQHCSGGFTLIELLVVLSVMVTLGGMLTLALSSAANEARVKKTQAQVLTISQLLQTKMNEISLSKVELAYGPSGQELVRQGVIAGPLALSGLGVSGSVTPQAFNAAERARLILLARRDMTRMVLPECQADLLYPPVSLQFRTPASATTGFPNVAQVKPPTEWIRMRKEAGLLTPSVVDSLYAPSNPCTDPAVDSATAAGDATFEGILRLSNKPGATFDPSTQSLPVPTSWTREHESAECLYLILAATELFGQKAIDRIPQTQITDLDGDLFPEIVDAWGEPLVFIRHPVGLRDPSIKNYIATEADPQLAFPQDPDPYDFLLSDFRYDRTSHPTSVPPNSVFPTGGPAPPPEAYESIYLPPAIISSGKDKVFGLFHSFEDINDDGVADIGCSAAYSSSVVQLEAGAFSPTYPGMPIVRYPDPFHALNFNDVSTGSVYTFSIDGALYAKSFVKATTPPWSLSNRLETGGGFGFDFNLINDSTGDVNDLRGFSDDNITSLDGDF